MTLTQLADDLATSLQSITAVGTTAARGNYIEDLSQEDLSTMRVIVTPQGMDVSISGRNVALYEYRVGVYVASRVSSSSESDAMYAVVEDIVDHIRQDSMTASDTTVACSEVSIEFSTDDSINERGLFRASISATYKAVKGP